MLTTSLFPVLGALALTLPSRRSLPLLQPAPLPLPPQHLPLQRNPLLQLRHLLLLYLLRLASLTTTTGTALPASLSLPLPLPKLRPAIMTANVATTDGTK